MRNVQSLSARDARRIALRASGFAPRRATSPGPRQVQSVLRSLGQLQIDSVNVFERAHYVPLFSRLGHFEKHALDGL
ncbi:MAG: winged helix-turn-helix domain-containing protein, partial [Agromyces sp.]